MSNELTSFSYRLEPRSDQEQVLLSYAGSVRWVWNHLLAYREEAYLAAKSAGGKLEPGQFGYASNTRYLTALRCSTPWLAANNCQIQQQVLRDLDKAFRAFFKGGGFPKFKSRHNRQTFRFPVIEAYWIKDDKVRLPGIGWVRFQQSRPIVGEIRNVTVSFDAGKWSIAFCLKGDFKTTNAGDDPVGLDLGIAQSVTSSAGEVIHFPVQDRKETKKIRFLQRKIARQRKGSTRRRRTIGRLSKLRRHVTNRVKDVQHKVSTRLARQHRIIVVEDLKLKQMTRSAKGTTAKPGKNVAAKSSLNRSMLQNAHARFRAMLEYKCARSGAKLISIPPAYTSQKCACCGHISPDNRKSQAKFECVKCEWKANADANASLNILATGLAASARGGISNSLADESRNHGGFAA